MKFKPVNRYILVEPIEISPVKKKKASVLLPENYNPKTERFKLCRTVAIGPECTRNVIPNSLAVVDNSMVERIEVLDNIFYLVLENHVVGVIDENLEDL